MSDVDASAGTARPAETGPLASSRLGLETFVLRLGTYAYALPGSIVLARSLGPAGRGSYQVAVTTCMVVVIVVLIGLPHSHYRSWGKRPAAELLAVSRLAAIVLGATGIGVCAVVAAVGGDTFDGSTGRAVLLIGASIPIQVHAACLSVILLSAARTRSVNLALAVSGALQTTAVLVLWSLDRLTVQSAAVAYAGGLAAQWLLLWWASRALGPPSALLPMRASWALARHGLILQVFVVGQFLLLRIDILLVAHIAGLGAVGVYSIAVTLAELVWLVTDSLTQSLVERATRDEETEALAVFVRAVRMTGLLGCLAAVGTGVLAPFGVRVLFGGDFADAAGLVAVLLPGAVMLGVWRTIGMAIVRFGSVWKQPAAAVAALSLNIGLNLVLIEPLGAMGAALSSSIAYTVLALLAMQWLLAQTGLGVGALVPRRTEAIALARAVSRRR